MGSAQSTAAEEFPSIMHENLNFPLELNMTGFVVDSGWLWTRCCNDGGMDNDSRAIVGGFTASPAFERFLGESAEFCFSRGFTVYWLFLRGVSEDVPPRPRPRLLSCARNKRLQHLFFAGRIKITLGQNNSHCIRNPLFSSFFLSLLNHKCKWGRGGDGVVIL